MISDTRALRHLAESQLRTPAALHDYQWEGVAFLYRASSALLADEMGLGKTVQTAVALALLLDGHSGVERVLIVAPASLTLNWMMELATWAPSVTARRVQGRAADREAYYLLPVPVLVSSYEQVRRDGLDRIPADAFDLVVLDEAQRIKNKNSVTTLASRLLPRKRAWALSATPLENHREDVASILSFLNPEIGIDIPESKLLERLKTMMLRRRKADVRAELPPVIVQDLKIDLSLPQRKKYDELWVRRREAVDTGASESVALLGLITRLKIICNFDADTGASSKLDALLAIVEGAGKIARLLVFSQFVETLKWISGRIDFPRCDFLTGSMSSIEQQNAMSRFKAKPAPRILLVSLRAGGVGLNLGEATHVVVFDRWWNPAVEMQAIYRAHRFNRSEPLHVVRFLIADSIEERIADILDRKESMFGEIIESSEAIERHFTMKELMQILALSAGDIYHPPSFEGSAQLQGEG